MAVRVGYREEEEDRGAIGFRYGGTGVVGAM